MTLSASDLLWAFLILTMLTLFPRPPRKSGGVEFQPVPRERAGKAVRRG